MTKYCRLSIRIISLITLGAFLFTQTALAGSGQLGYLRPNQPHKADAKAGGVEESIAKALGGEVKKGQKREDGSVKPTGVGRAVAQGVAENRLTDGADAAGRAQFASAKGAGGDKASTVLARAQMKAQNRPTLMRNSFRDKALQSGAWHLSNDSELKNICSIGIKAIKMR